MIGQKIKNLRVSSDVTSLAIKNPENYPYLTVSLNALVFDLTQLCEDDIGTYEAIL